MSKNLSAKYHQENKEILQKQAYERYQNHSKVEKEKKRLYGPKRYKISQKMKKINWLSIEKNIIELEKTLYYSYQKILLLYNGKYEKLFSFEFIFEKVSLNKQTM